MFPSLTDINCFHSSLTLMQNATHHVQILLLVIVDQFSLENSFKNLTKIERQFFSWMSPDKV